MENFFLFTTLTSELRSSTELRHLQKFSDDTANVGCVETGREGEYRNLVDFRKNKPCPLLSASKELSLDLEST